LPIGKAPKLLGTITLNIIVTNVTSEIYNATSPLLYNGSIIVTASGGIAPYTYSIIIGQQNYQLNNGYFPGLNAGAYLVTVTDASGQSVDTTILVKYTYPLPTLSASNIVTPSICSGNDGSFELLGSGGVPPYLYSIDGGNSFTSNGIFAGLKQGLYTVIMKDANGQIAVIGVNPTSINAGYIDLYCNSCNCGSNVQYSANDCTNEGYIHVTSFSYNPPVSFSLDGINYRDLLYYPNLNFEFYYDSLGLPPGFYQVYLKDGTGLVSSTSVPITKYCNIDITYVGIDASCHQSDGSFTVTAVNGTPPYTYTIDGVNFQTSNIFTGLASGTYYVTAKDADGQMNSSLATVYNKCPNVTATETDETCGQKNGTITATGYKGTTPYQFSIDGINFQSSNIFTGLGSGIYNVTIRDANGFKDSTEITVNNNCVQLFLSITNTTCGNSNGSINITASNGTSPYRYSIDGVNFVPNSQFNNLVAGNYTVTARDANGLLKDSTVAIGDAARPQTSITTTPASCANKGGSITINATGGTAPLSFSADNGNSFGTNNIFSNLDSGQYIMVTKDANGCSFSDTTRLTALPTPSFSLGNDTSICMGQSLLISAPDSSSYSYQWQDNSNGQTYLASANGLYSVKVTNGYGCSSSDTIKLALRTLPVFSLGNDTTVCNGHVYYLTPKFNSPSNGLVYTWSDGTTGRPSLLVNAPGLYWMQSSDGGCAFRDSITVSYKPSPAVALGNDTTLCDGQTILLDATNNGSSYLWQDGSTQATYLVDRAGAYSVKVDEDGCDTTGSITVAYISKPIINLGTDTTVCVTQQLVLDASYPNSTYEWQDGSTSPRYTVTTAGTYSVSVTDQCGATLDSIRVVYENCACKFYIPNGFTPNCDGLNDLFQPKYQCLFSNYVLRVFNRWGQLVFTSNNPNTGWDGNLAGQQQPPGTYVWELAYRDSLTGKDMRKSGTVVLVR
jgi:gliding motility-associated-like protein